MNIKYYSLKVNDKILKQFDSKEDAIKEFINLENKEKKLYEITITDDGLNKKLIYKNKPFHEIKWFEIHNTTSEYSSECTGKYETFDEAKEDLKNKEDWYKDLETGSIYECSINNVDFDVKRNLIFRN